ncbi:VWA domain-containing protein [Kutzneria buriramensis]|uniref:Uncharacterized protein with von Willebrand factor type A (VWA) domain n=1 Tax=Kutzneria buriramensis TaxID=1045776 RepID=A0A3E0GWW4_9PSEU|nr:VWA domain-containing protein [Kutzneria buriramensis]REH31056.1 uncharacterized protein with von Willebrand factor type A (vWA) domain [Kutzneria buriramensis]
MGALTKLADLARRAGRWLTQAVSAPAARHAAAVAADRFDEMMWRDTLEQSGALRDLADELAETHDHTSDLLRDLFAAAYKVDPQVRGENEMLTSRLPNRQIIASMLDSPEFDDLRRETVGDQYASAMAVLAQADTLRSLLDRTEDARDQAEQAERAQQQLALAAQQVSDELNGAEQAADADGDVAPEAAESVESAIAGAEQAEHQAAAAGAGADAALAGHAAAVRSEMRQAMATAAEQARQEAALMAAWGVNPGQLERMSFEQRAELASRLRTNRMARFVDLVGRFRVMAEGERARAVEHAPGELIGVTLGDDLGLVIPSEIANLGVPALRAAFAARYAERRLLVFDTKGEEKAGRGAIIACVDCSGTMGASHTTTDGRTSTREAWAKAAALALLDQARARKRDFVGILFSSKHEVQAFHFPARQALDIDAVLEFAETFFNGGTDFEAPLGLGVEMLATEHTQHGRAHGDIVLITDGLAEISEAWMRDWLDAKRLLDFRLFGVRIAPGPPQPDDVLTTLCDNLRDINDLADPDPVADLFRLL